MESSEQLQQIINIHLGRSVFCRFGIDEHCLTMSAKGRSSGMISLTAQYVL